MFPSLCPAAARPSSPALCLPPLPAPCFPALLLRFPPLASHPLPPLPPPLPLLPLLLLLLLLSPPALQLHFTCGEPCCNCKLTRSGPQLMRRAAAAAAVGFGIAPPSARVE